MTTDSSILLTKRAKVHVQHYLGGHATAAGLRLGVKTTGCSGYSYVVSVAEEISDHDRVFDVSGICVVIDDLSLPLLQGTEVDYVRDGVNAGLRFSNPNATGTCGCGESFNMDRKHED